MFFHSDRFFLLVKYKNPLVEGVRDHHYINRRPRLLTFLKGAKIDKLKLSNDYPEEYAYFDKIWEIRKTAYDPSTRFFL